jgi:hypothetical protein
MKRGCVFLATETKAQLQAWSNLTPWQQQQGTSSVKVRKNHGSTTIMPASGARHVAEEVFCLLHDEILTYLRKAASDEIF